jgi:hypothetical protein
LAFSVFGGELWPLLAKRAKHFNNAVFARPPPAPAPAPHVPRGLSSAMFPALHHVPALCSHCGAYLAALSLLPGCFAVGDGRGVRGRCQATHTSAAHGTCFCFGLELVSTFRTCWRACYCLLPCATKNSKKNPEARGRDQPAIPGRQEGPLGSWPLGSTG